MNALPAVRAALTSRTAFRLLVLVLAAALVALLVWRFAGSAQARAGSGQAPANPAMENSLGIRMDSVQLVAAGGIVEVRYTVLDAVKASKFQDDVHHPPVLHSEQHGGNIYRTALMKQGHDLRPGQTYYVLYLNNANAVHRGDTLEIDAGRNRLQHVPVQ
jgi:hypothetical protein